MAPLCLGKTHNGMYSKAESAPSCTRNLILENKLGNKLRSSWKLPLTKGSVLPVWYPFWAEAKLFLSALPCLFFPVIPEAPNSHSTRGKQDTGYKPSKLSLLRSSNKPL